MQTLLYGDLVDWYYLIDPTEDHREEVDAYLGSLARAIGEPPRELLELGSGGGNNAFHMKRSCRCTLSDVSPPMLALSRGLNPECEHLEGDMRTMRLDRTFDAVLVHDSIVYMTTAEDLLAAVRTAFVHTRPGGAAIFAPDCVKDTFCESSSSDGSVDGSRALRYLEWSWDPDPDDETYAVEYALLMRDGADVKAAHDRHVEGLFPRATWERVLATAGFQVDVMSREVDEGYFDHVFVGRRPA